MLVRTARRRQAVRVAERVGVREIGDDEGHRLLRIIRSGSGSVVTWRNRHADDTRLRQVVARANVA
jgi:hypothetical protein